MSLNWEDWGGGDMLTADIGFSVDVCQKADVIIDGAVGSLYIGENQSGRYVWFAVLNHRMTQTCITARWNSKFHRFQGRGSDDIEDAMADAEASLRSEGILKERV